MLKTKKYLLEDKKREYDGNFEYQLKIKVGERRIQIIISVGRPFTSLHFVANCYKMDLNYNIKPLLIPHGHDVDSFSNSVYDDIINQRLALIGSLDNIKSFFETRASYTKLIRDSVFLINAGWKLDTKMLNFKIYDNTKDHKCAICFDSVLEGNSLKLQACNHVFHLGCISENLMEFGPAASKCPVCRTEIISYDHIKKELII